MTTRDEMFEGFPSRGGGREAIEARAAFVRLLWTPEGDRLLPSLKALDAAINALPPGDLDWLCEFNPLGPVYLLPTTEWIEALAAELAKLEVKRVVEVAAGDGFLARCLAEAAPSLEVIATDSHAWARAKARMSDEEAEALKDVPVAGIRMGAHVRRMAATTAVKTLQPDLVLASWLPPGPLLDRLIRSDVRWVLDVGAAGGVTTSAWSWRFDHDQLDGPLEQLGRCRLDERPPDDLQTRVTLYKGKAHPEHWEEKPQEGDWLWQFRPVK